jgi:hypothetical protein
MLLAVPYCLTGYQPFITHILTVHPVIVHPAVVLPAAVHPAVAFLPGTALLPVHQVALPVLMVLEDTPAKYHFTITIIVIPMFK